MLRREKAQKRKKITPLGVMVGVSVPKNSLGYELMRYDVNAQVEEGTGQELKGRPGGRPRANRAAAAKGANPSSPTASWDSAPAQHSRMRSQYGASQVQYPVSQNASSSYDKVRHLSNSLGHALPYLMLQSHLGALLACTVRAQITRLGHKCAAISGIAVLTQLILAVPHASISLCSLQCVSVCADMLCTAAFYTCCQPQMLLLICWLAWPSRALSRTLH